LSVGVALLAGAISAGAIVAKVKALEAKIGDLQTRARMDTSADGKTRERVFDLSLLRDGVGYRALLSLVEPLEMAGTRFLIVAERGKRNRVWAYFPDLEVVRPVATKSQDDPFLGSDVTYADLAGGAHWDDLVHRLTGEEVIDGTACYVIEGTPRHEIAYGKLTAWIAKDSFRTLKARFEGRDGKLVKEARLSDFTELAGAPVARRIEVESHVRASRTVISLSDIKVNQNLSPDRFTEAALKKS